MKSSKKCKSNKKSPENAKLMENSKNSTIKRERYEIPFEKLMYGVYS